MIVITWDPVAFEVGPIAIRWVGIFLAAGVLAGLWMARRALEHAASDREALTNAAAWAVPCGIVGARLVHVLGGWEYYVTRPGQVWQLQAGGLSLWGGLLVGAAVAAIVLRRDPLRRTRLFDAAVPAVLVGLLLGRIGGFINGDGLGRETSLPWGTQYTSEWTSVPDFGVFRHPVLLYDALALVLLLAATRPLRRAPLGSRFWGILAAYGAWRVVLAPVLLDPPFLFGMQLDQLLALLALGFSLFQLGSAASRRVRPRPLERAA